MVYKIELIFVFLRCIYCIFGKKWNRKGWNLKIYCGYLSCVIVWMYLVESEKK